MTNRSVLPRSTPEAQGVSSTAILDFIEDVEQNIHEMHSFMLLRHGAVIAEGWWHPYAPDVPHMLYSLSKSFTSTAVGFAVAEGLLSVDNQVVAFFPHSLPEKGSRNLANMRVRHLLSMSTGHTEDTTAYLLKSRDGNWVKAFFSRPVRRKPGTFFLYNTGATYMLSAIIQKCTKQTLLEYLQTRLFDPLDIHGATWETCPRGINTGGFGLSVKTEDIAKFGQLYLQKGAWHGKQLLPQAWIDEATSKQIDNGSNPNSDWEQGYGYQFWRCRHNCYRGDGAFGQYCIVMPDQDAVLAITAGLPDMQAVLDLVWKHLLPAMQPNALPADNNAYEKLTHKTKTLHYSPPQGLDSPLAGKISGKRVILDHNLFRMKSIRFDFSGDTGVLTFTIAKKSIQLKLGNRRWEMGDFIFAQFDDALDHAAATRVAASGTWIAENIFQATLRLYETPYVQTFTFSFEGGQVQVGFKQNVSFGPTEFPPLTGHLYPWRLSDGN